MPPEYRPLAVLLILLRALLPLVLLHPAWGFHIDELLYAAMGDHLSWVTMQFPPLVPLVSRLGVELFGTDVLSARVPAALAGAALTAVVLSTVVQLGGGRIAMVMAAAGMAVAPVYLRPSVLLHPVIFDQLWCAVALLGVMRVRAGAGRAGWLLVGVGLGLGALTKFTVAVYGLAVAVAVLATPLRSELRTRWPWLAAALAAVLSVPTVVGQVVHGWPLLEQLQVLAAEQLNRVTPAEFLGEQGLMLGPAALLVASGVLAARQLHKRALVHPLLVAAAAIIGFFLLRQGKAYYAAPAYPPLIAAGAVMVEQWSAAAGRRWIAAVAITVMLVLGAALLPIGIPMLAPAPMARYASALGLTAAVRTNRGEVQSLPQDYVDMLGWDQLTDSVQAVMARLPAADRARVRIIGTSYGRAGAVARLGVPRGLPYPVSPNSNFHEWGPGDAARTLLLVIASAPEHAKDYCTAPRVAAQLRPAWNVTREIGRVIVLCEEESPGLAERWGELGPRWE